VGITRAGIVYELFFTNLPRASHSAPAMSSNCTCIVELICQLSPMKTANSTPTDGAATRPGDRNAGRWSPNGSGTRLLELGHVLKPEPLRTTEFAPALCTLQAEQAPAQGYEPPVVGGAWKAGRYAGKDFALQPDGTVCCPAGKRLFPQEQRQERD